MNIFFSPNQEAVFFNMAVLGVLLGLLFDSLSVKRQLICDNFIICLIDDVIFVIVSGIAFLIGVFVTNNGIIRWYEFFCCIFGFAVYKLTLSVLIMKVMRKLVELIHKALRLVLKAVLAVIKPFTLPLKFIFRLVLVMLRPVCRAVKVSNEKRKIIYGFRKMCKIGK